jgi:UDP-N-acetyl-D-galactosamine dehydrogenase
VYPGTTEEFCVPILERYSELIYNKDFFCGYSPERINPGDRDRTLKKITKITSGSNEKTANFVDQLYQSILSVNTFKAKSIAIAEAAKVIENIQRDVNIALINELSMIFNKLGLDTNEVLEAAGTKWNFLPFQPGLVGGHCIGVDPYYLTHRATEIGYHPEMILTGRRINDSMGKYIADCAIAEMAKAGINTVNAKVAVLGITFKENCPDIRNTKVSDIVNNLISYGCQIDIVDPYANPNEIKELFDLDLMDFDKLINYSAIVLCVAHDEFKSISIKEWKKMINKKGVLIDVKSLYPKDFFKEIKISHWRL